MLLLRRGDRAIISDAAAMPIAIIAVITGSMGIQCLQNYSSDLALVPLNAFRDRQAFLYGLNAML